MKTCESEPPSVRLKESHKKGGLPTSQHPEDYHVPGRPQVCFSETVLGHWDMTGKQLSIRPNVKEGKKKIKKNNMTLRIFHIQENK